MITARALKHPYIMKRKGLQGGRAVVAGSRIPVSTIVNWYKIGKEIYEILEMYPQLSPSQVHDAMSYYYDHIKEIEDEIASIQDESFWKRQFPPGKGVSAHSDTE